MQVNSSNEHFNKILLLTNNFYLFIQAFLEFMKIVFVFSLLYDGEWKQKSTLRAHKIKFKMRINRIPWKINTFNDCVDPFSFFAKNAVSSSTVVQWLMLAERPWAELHETCVKTLFFNEWGWNKNIKINGIKIN